MTIKPRMLGKNTKGAVAIEFAFIAPVLFFLLFSIIELGFVVLASTAIESATSISTRTARIGNDAGTGDLVAYIREEIRARSSGLVNSADIIITTDLRSFEVIPKPERCFATPTPPIGTCPDGAPFDDRNGNGVYDGDLPALDLGGPGDIVKFKVHYNWEVLTPFLEPLLGDDKGRYLITSIAYVKNEPF